MQQWDDAHDGEECCEDGEADGRVATSIQEANAEENGEPSDRPEKHLVLNGRKNPQNDPDEGHLPLSDGLLEDDEDAKDQCQ
jgi:hypothetical protein